MVVRRFNFKGKPVYLDELFNVSADKEQDEHLGVLQTKVDGNEFYISGGKRMTKAKLTDPVEKAIFVRSRRLFNILAERAAKKKEEKMFAPYVAVGAGAGAPTPVAPVAAPVIDPRRVVMTERGGVMVKLVRGGKLLSASEEEELEERREAARRVQYEKEEREAEQAYYMAEE